MKKLALIIAISAAALLAACGGKQTENIQTEAAAQQGAAGGPAADAIEQTRPTTIVELPDEYEQCFFEGVVSDYTGAILTVDGEDSTMRFDVSNADSENTSPILRGCYVELVYADAAQNDVYPSESVSILLDNEQLAESEMRDPVIYGVLQYADVNELVIIDDAGRNLDFDNVISRTVSFSELKSGDAVAVTYCGSIESSDGEDEGIFSGVPVALKIVAVDAIKTEDAEANYIDGIAGNITDIGLQLTTELTDFDCSADAAALAGIEDGDPIRVYYTGSLADITVSAEKIEKR